MIRGERTHNFSPHLTPSATFARGLLMAFGTVAKAQAATIVKGSITKPNEQTTTVNYFNFSVNTAGTVTIDAETLNHDTKLYIIR